MARGREQAAVLEAPVEGPWELPEGWRWERLGNLADYISRGRGPKYVESNGIPVLNQKCIRWHGIDLQHAKLTSTEAAAKLADEQWLQAGDILWNSTGTGTIGRAAIVPQQLASSRYLVDSHVTIVRPSKVDSRWLCYWIATKFIQSKVAGTGSTNQVELNRSTVNETLVPVPPLDTQRRIVARIDELFSELDDGEMALARAREDLEVYRKALLKAAVTGELTADWRAANPPKETGEQLLQRILAERRARWEADPKNKGKRYKEPAAPDTSGLPELPEGWAWAKAPQLLEWSSGKFLPENQMRPGNVPVYGGNGIAGYHEAALTSCRTLIIGRVGYYCGNAHSSNGPAWVTDNAIYASEISEIVSVEYLKLVFESANLRERSQGGAQPFVSQKMLNEVWLPLPGSEEQLQIAQQYELQIMATASLADNIGENVSSELRQSILAAAFKGELVQ